MTSAAGPVSRALWVPVTMLSVSELHAAIDRIIAEHRKELVLNVNIHAMNLAYELPWLHAIFERASIVFCDGAGVMVALRLLAGDRVPERITYADWTWQLAAHCEVRGHRLFLLGGKPGIAEKAAAQLRARHPGLVIAGCQHGYFEKTGAENAAVVRRINAAAPHVVIVAFGMPLQERWVADNLDALAANVLLTAGAALDYVSGTVPRGPRMLVDHGGEWLARLVIEPRRLWRRYLIGNPKFMFRAWRWARRHR